MATAKILAMMGMDPSKFNAGVASAGDSVEKLKKKNLAKMGGIIAGAFSVTAIVGFANKVIQLGSEITDLSAQLEIGVEEIQALQEASIRAGVSSDILTRALRNIKQRTQQAADGNKSYQQALDRLGVTTSELLRLPLERQLERIAQGYANAENKSEAFRSVAVILGERAGPQLIEVLNRLAKDGFDSVSASAHATGQIMTEETAVAMDMLADKQEQLKKSAQATAANWAVKWGQGAVMLKNLFTGQFKEIGGVIQDHNEDVTQRMKDAAKQRANDSEAALHEMLRKNEEAAGKAADKLIREERALKDEEVAMQERMLKERMEKIKADHDAQIAEQQKLQGKLNDLIQARINEEIAADKDAKDKALNGLRERVNAQANAVDAQKNKLQEIGLVEERQIDRVSGLIERKIADEMRFGKTREEVVSKMLDDEDNLNEKKNRLNTEQKVLLGLLEEQNALATVQGQLSDAEVQSTLDAAAAEHEKVLARDEEIGQLQGLIGLGGTYKDVISSIGSTFVDMDDMNVNIKSPDIITAEDLNKVPWDELNTSLKTLASLKGVIFK